MVFGWRYPQSMDFLNSLNFLKMKKILFLAFVLVFIGCKKSSTGIDNLQTKAVDSIERTEVASPKKIDATKTTLPRKRTECFVFAKNKDTTAVELTFDGDIINGKMHWNPLQKDGAVGTLDGTFKNDTLVVVYSFMIEGNSQKEEKIFVYNKKTLTELVGALYDNNGVMTIKNKKSVTLRNILVKTENFKYKFPN